MSEKIDPTTHHSSLSTLHSPGVLVLEDGTVYPGTLFGAPVETAAEVVFNTGMAGYQEICTDPSYRGQMVVLTHPQIGNYGVDAGVSESTRPWVAALIVRELAAYHHHWSAAESLDDYLRRHGVAGLQDVDTRALTRRLRTRGTLRGVLAPAPAGGLSAAYVESLVERARALPWLSDRDVVGEVTGAARLTPPQSPPTRGGGEVLSPVPRGEGGRGGRSVVVLDCGAKHNIVRSLQRRGVPVVVIEATADLTADAILSPLPPVGEGRDARSIPCRGLRGQPAGIVLANGPGDPAALPHVAGVVRELLATDVPIMGICLGHQLLALAAGGTTSRLKYGHHGANHPVKDLRTGRVHITSQNHEFQVDAASLPPDSGFYVSHVNLNDGSVEGIAHRERPIFSVQFHPEGCPGPQDNQYLFDYFLDELVARRVMSDE
jgi:carbamoyl-phosphate synthase small subunit